MDDTQTPVPDRQRTAFDWALGQMLDAYSNGRCAGAVLVYLDNGKIGVSSFGESGPLIAGCELAKAHLLDHLLATAPFSLTGDVPEQLK